MGYVPKALFGPNDIAPKIEPAKAPKALFGDSVAAKPIVRSETLFVDTVVRHRVKLTVDELGTLHPDASQAVVNRAHEIIITTNLDQIRERDIVLIGSEAQKKYGGLVDGFASAMNGGMINSCKQTIGRIVTSLESAMPSRFTFFKKDRKSVDGIYGSIKKEIDILVSAAPFLLIGKEHLDDISEQSVALQEILLAHEIAAGFLAQNVDTRYSGVLLSRQSSLLSSRLGINQLVSQIGVMGDAILQLATLVQDVLLVEIPIWYNNQLLSLSDKSAITLANSHNQKLLNILK